MIRTENLTKRFGDFTALSELDLTVPKGAVYGLVGPNGAGKSTVIRHILGAYRPDSGRVLVDGQPVYENAPLKARIGNIPDDFYFPITATMKEMKRYYSQFYKSFDNARYMKLAQVFPELDEKKPLRAMSKGMQKQAAFWLVLSCRPEVLVLDEPVDGLDPVMRRQVWSLVLNDVAENGTTVLVSSHNLRELEDVCDHVGIMEHGKMMLQHSLSELQDNIVKVQLALPEGRQLLPMPADLKLLHYSTLGRVQTLIIRGDPQKTEAFLREQGPLVLDMLPLTLEEIFIYELGGKDYAVKDILV